MSEEIPQELIGTGLEWVPTGNAGQYCAHDGDDMLWCHVHDRTYGIEILRFDDIGRVSAGATRPTAAEALAVARRMIEAAR